MDLPSGYHHEKMPVGDVGSRASIWKVAKAGTEGRMDPKVRAEAIRALKAAGNPKSIKAKGDAILAAVRKNLIYVPDPVHGEFMPSARELVDGTFVGEDCDGMSLVTIALMLAALESVGITAAAVGHSYRKDGDLQHVLVAIWDPEVSCWWYADGTTNTPFGEWPAVPSWEYVVSAPGMQLLCDAEVCLRGPQAIGPEVLTMDGDYVGVAGLPAPEKLGIGVGAGVGAPIAYLRDLKSQLEEAWDAFLQSYETMSRVHAVLGIPLLDATATPVTLANVAEVTSWGPDLAQKALDLQEMKRLAIGYIDDAIAGRRTITAIASDYALGLLPTDTIQIIETAAGPALAQVSDGKIVHGSGAIGVGIAPAAAFALGAGVLIAILAVCWVLKSAADNATKSKTADAYQKCLDKGDPTLCENVGKIIDPNAGQKGPGEDASSFVRSVTWLTVVGLLGWGAVKILPEVAKALEHRRRPPVAA